MSNEHKTISGLTKSQFIAQMAALGYTSPTGGNDNQLIYGALLALARAVNVSATEQNIALSLQIKRINELDGRIVSNIGAT
jgi:hypothetical protein